MSRWRPAAWSAAAVLAAVMGPGLQAQALQPAAGQQAPAQQTMDAARAAMNAGQADQALALLHSLGQKSGEPAEALNLECQLRLALRQWDAAVEACQQAVRMDGQNGLYHLWLGRALGQKAGNVSFLSAYSLGKRVRTEFEEAVRLNPRNAEALSDLGSFYNEAPGFMGGGAEKAESVAAQLNSLDPAGAAELRGRIAEVRKDYETAEREFRRAIAAAPHPANKWAALASFLERRQRWDDMESAVRSCDGAAGRDSRAAVAFYDCAGVLINARRDPQMAAKMLEEYLSSSSKSLEAPAFEAYVRLAKLEDSLGDSAAAGRDRDAALALAREYQPAQEAKRH